MNKALLYFQTFTFKKSIHFTLLKERYLFLINPYWNACQKYNTYKCMIHAMKIHVKCPLQSLRV